VGLFSFFEIFTAEFCQFLLTKKYFFVTEKRLNSAVKEKVFRFGVGEIKNNSQLLKKTIST
jgi:hypothetical protein